MRTSRVGWIAAARSSSTRTRRGTSPRAPEILPRHVHSHVADAAASRHRGSREAPRVPGVSGYIELPAGWERVEARGPCPFVTHETPAPSRRQRGELALAPASQGSPRPCDRGRDAACGTGVVAPAQACLVDERPVLDRLALLHRCRDSGAVGEHSRPGIGVTFFVGSIFFTSASYLQYVEAVNVPHALDEQPRGRFRPASWEPGRIDWLAAAVQLAGTVFFNVSTFAAMKTGLTTHQANARVWAPDALGSICFLVSSALAYAEVCHRWVCFDRRSLSWRIVALNLLGSIAFGASAIASWVEPASGEPVSARITNAGTALGGLCFLIAAIALMPEAAAQERAAPEPGAGAPSSRRIRVHQQLGSRYVRASPRDPDALRLGPRRLRPRRRQRRAARRGRAHRRSGERTPVVRGAPPRRLARRRRTRSAPTRPTTTSACTCSATSSRWPTRRSSSTSRRATCAGSSTRWTIRSRSSPTATRTRWTRWTRRGSCAAAR